MADAGSRPPLRVEQALRLVPEVDALAPLRALLIATSRPDDRGVWASSGPYLTVGKRVVQSGELGRQIPTALEQVRRHLTVLYQAVVEALRAEQDGEGAAACAALLRAGGHEEAVGRFGQARSWYEAALSVGDGLTDRRAEMVALGRLGALCTITGNYEAAARYHQRSLALAEAAFAQTEIVDACRGLGQVALAEGAWSGAHAWLTRGLRIAAAAGDALRSAQLRHELATLALRRGDLASAATELALAREGFERLGAAEDMARALNSQGLLEAALGRQRRTSGAYREALAWCRRSGHDLGLEVTIRLNLAELFLGLGRYLEAAEAARRAEQVAISGGLARQLVTIYAFLGRLHGAQGDEGGFVFFEKALELCRSLDSSPLLEGQTYHAYGLFRQQLGDVQEARQLLERARESLARLGAVPELQVVQAELQTLSA